MVWVSVRARTFAGFSASLTPSATDGWAPPRGASDSAGPVPRAPLPAYLALTGTIRRLYRRNARGRGKVPGYRVDFLLYGDQTRPAVTAVNRTPPEFDEPGLSHQTFENPMVLVTKVEGHQINVGRELKPHAIPQGVEEGSRGGHRSPFTRYRNTRA